MTLGEMVKKGTGIPFELDRPSVGDCSALLVLLTRQEERVACLVASGLSNRDIADSLYVSTETIDVHMNHIYHKMVSVVGDDRRSPRYLLTLMCLRWSGVI